MTQVAKKGTAERKDAGAMQQEGREMRDPLIDLFGHVLEVDAAGLSDASSPETVKNWDSLRGMQLVAEIEERFVVELSTDEIMAMESIGAARSVLKDKGVAGL